MRSDAERSEWVVELRRLYAADPEQWPAPNVDPEVAWKEIGPLPKVEHPATNPHNPDKEKLARSYSLTQGCREANRSRALPATIPIWGGRMAERRALATGVFRFRAMRQRFETRGFIAHFFGMVALRLSKSKSSQCFGIRTKCEQRKKP